MQKKRLSRQALVLFRRNIRLVTLIVWLLSLAMIGAGMFIRIGSQPASALVVLKVGLMETGTTILIATTIGLFITESYETLRELTIRDEIYGLLDRMGKLISQPDEIVALQRTARMELAGLVNIFPTRKGTAQEDLRSKLEALIDIKKEITVRLFGDTLRVFFGSEGPFTYSVHKLLSTNPFVRFKVLLLNPNCRLALIRSEAETTGSPFSNDAEYRQGGLFIDSMQSTTHIREWNRTLEPLRGNIPIEARYYSCADYCFAAIFPAVCYTAQYLYADAEAQVQTPNLPMYVFSRDSSMYQRLLWNFDFVWNTQSITYDEMMQSLEETPVVQVKSEGKLLL